MSRDSINWPSLGDFPVVDSSGKQYRIDVRRDPAAPIKRLDECFIVTRSDAYAYFLDTGIELERDRDDEGVFRSYSPDEIYRKA